MKLPPLARELALKAERALCSARELQDRDPDGSVNRSYFAMFDIARAALLRAGVRKEDLPRTHGGVIGAFSKHAVLTGKIDQKLSAALGRAELPKWPDHRDRNMFYSACLIISFATNGSGGNCADPPFLSGAANSDNRHGAGMPAPGT